MPHRRFAIDRFEHRRAPTEFIDAADQSDYFGFPHQPVENRFNVYVLVACSQATSHLKTHRKISIQNFDDFHASCINSPVKLAKLRNISLNPVIKRLSMDKASTMKKIKEVIDEYGLSVTVTEEGDQEMLVYKSANQWAILQLLDDGYLESPVSGEQYEAKSKRVHRSGKTAAT